MSRDQYRGTYGNSEIISDQPYGGYEEQDVGEDHDVHQVNMPDQDRVARTLANPEYWNKKNPIKTDGMGNNFQRRKVSNPEAHYTLLRETQEQLKGTKLNIYFHTEY